MSKYNALWEYVQKRGEESFRLTFGEIGSIAGVRSTIPSDLQEGTGGIWVSGRKSSIKEQTVLFSKMD
jgi:hypothetical protein